MKNMNGDKKNDCLIRLFSFSSWISKHDGDIAKKRPITINN